MDWERKEMLKGNDFVLKPLEQFENRGGLFYMFFNWISLVIIAVK